MNVLRPVWHPVYTGLLLSVLPLAGGMVLATWPATHPLVFAVAYLVTFGLGLALAPFVAGLVGLGAAAVLVAAQQALGTWGAALFAVHVAEVLLLPAVGVAAALLSRRLAPTTPRAAPAPREDDVLGPFAFLAAPYGRARLEEEVERALLFGRPLSLLHVTASFDAAPALDRDARLRLQRTVARVVEGMLRATDVPFTYTDEASGQRHVVCILPETKAADARLLVSLHQDAVDRATFGLPRTEARARVRDHAHVRFAVAALNDDGRTAEALLAAARDDAHALFTTHPDAPDEQAPIKQASDEQASVEQAPGAASAETPSAA